MMRVTATFTGKNSLGYINGKDYNLVVYRTKPITITFGGLAKYRLSEC